MGWSQWCQTVPLIDIFSNESLNSQLFLLLFFFFFFFEIPISRSTGNVMQQLKGLAWNTIALCGRAVKWNTQYFTECACTCKKALKLNFYSGHFWLMFLGLPSMFFEGLDDLILHEINAWLVEWMTVADPGFPVEGGVDLVGGGRGPPRWLHFENFACQNERIWTHRGARAGCAPPP